MSADAFNPRAPTFFSIRLAQSTKSHRPPRSTQWGRSGFFDGKRRDAPLHKGAPLSGRDSAHHDPLTPAGEGSEIRAAGTPTAAFLAIYYRYFNFVWSSAKYMNVAADALDDVVQEVFVVIHSRLYTLQNQEAMRSWIFGIVRRKVSAHHRAHRARTGLEARWALSRTAAPETPLHHAERSAKIELLASLLAELDEAKREVFVAAELQEMSVPEIAAALEIPLNTVYSRLRAARQLFEERLAQRTGREKGNKET